MKPFKKRGQWWLPGSDTQIPGTLTFDVDGGVHLNIEGSLQSHPDVLGEIPIIHGIIEDSKIVTLQNNYVFGSTMSRYPTQRIRVQLAVIGDHVGAADTTHYGEFYCGFQNLTQWCGTVPIAPSLTQAHQDDISISVTARRPTPLVVETSWGRFVLEHDIGTGGQLPESYTLNANAVWAIFPTGPTTFEHFLDNYIAPMQDMLSLACDTPVDLSFCRGRQNSSSRSVEFFYQPVSHFSGSSERPFRNDFAFQLSDLQPVVDVHLEQWLTAYRDLRPAMKLYFASLYNRSMFLDQRFIYLTQAVEAYHRRRYPGKAVSGEVHEQRLNAILSAVPPEHKKWLGERLKYSNEVSLRVRLKELFADVAPVVAPVVKSRGAWIHTVIATRNYLVHQDDSLKIEAAEGARFFWVTEALDYLMQAMLLRELGLSSNQQELFNRLPRWRHAQTMSALAG